MNSERISAAQSEIKTYLPDRATYLVDTSEFEAVKARLIALEGGLRLHTGNSGNRPVLRKRTDTADAGDAGPSATSSSNSTDSADDRPTLKRAPASSN